MSELNPLPYLHKRIDKATLTWGLDIQNLVGSTMFVMDFTVHICTLSVLNYKSFDFFNIKFDYSSYLKNLYKYNQI